MMQKADEKLGNGDTETKYAPTHSGDPSVSGPLERSTPQPAGHPCRVNAKLLPVKLLVLLIHGGVAALFPYFTLHMKSVGISVKEIAWMLLLLPIVSSIGPPLGGALADKIGNYKIVLIIFTVLSVILHTVLWFGVPVYSIVPQTVPKRESNANFIVTFPCNNSKVTIKPFGATARILRNCSIDREWLPAELTDCWSDCKERKLPEPRICFTGSVSFEKQCYDWLDIKFLLITDAAKRNGTWTASALSAPWLPAGGLGEAKCVGAESSPANCSVSCEASSGNNLECMETTFVGKGSRLATIASYFTWRFLSFTAMRVVFPLSDAAVLEIAKQNNGDFGIQRLFSSVGFCLVPPLSGWLIDVATARSKYPDYSPAFYIFGILSLLSALLMICMPFGARKPQADIWRSMLQVIKNPNVLAFTVAIFFSGMAFGVLVNFLFLFMREDKEFTAPASRTILGLTSTVGYLLGIPLLYFSTQLIRKFGHENIVALGLLCYSGRFLAYSFTYNPYLVLPTEILTAVTGMLIVVGPQFAIKTSPKYLATLVGLFGAVNFGLGGGVGPLVGGLLIHAFGYRTTFRIFFVICVCVGLLYFLVYHLVLKRRSQKTDHTAADEKAASSRLPVITALEVEPLAPGIESIVHDGKQPSAPYSPPVIFRNKNLQLDDPLSVEPSYYRNKDGSAVFRPIHEQQQLLTPGQEVSRTSTVTASDDALNDPIALAPPPPIANWRNEHRRTSNF